MGEAAIHTAMDAARLFLSDTAERRRYINREMARMDHDSSLLYAHRKGVKEGLEEGRAEGRAEGRQEGEERMGRLIQLLVQANDFANIQAASTDKAIRESLYRKYNIV